MTEVKRRTAALLLAALIATGGAFAASAAFADDAHALGTGAEGGNANTGD
jgi:hypothetical protein